VIAYLKKNAILVGYFYLILFHTKWVCALMVKRVIDTERIRDKLLRLTHYNSFSSEE